MARSTSTMSLSAAQQSFIEKFSQLITEIGLPPSIARVVGFLLICEPSSQSAETIQMQLKLSAGAVSTAVLLLQQLGIVQRVTFPEDRHFYYELDPQCWRKLVETRREQMRRGRALADEGLAISKDNQRLKGMRSLYATFEASLGQADLED